MQPPRSPGSALLSVPEILDPSNVVLPLGQWSLPPGHDEIAHCAPPPPLRTVLVWITPWDRQTMSSIGGVCILNGVAQSTKGILFGRTL